MAPARNAHVLVEVAVESIAGAVTAAAAGAHRLELCSGLIDGGLTPSIGLLEAVREAVEIPVFAMVRPRGGDFLYDDSEFDVMQRDLELLGSSGADGFVTGALTADGQLDTARLAGLKKLAQDRPLTCHRAFDLCADAEVALDLLAQLGYERVLTSGQAASAMAGAATIARLVELAGDDITILAGAGVRADNARELVQRTGCREVHLSATTWRESGMRFRRDGVPMGVTPPPDEYVRRATDGDMVAGVIAAVAPH